MKKKSSLPVAIILAAALIAAVSCSGSKDTGSNDNGGGSTREFASGDLSQGQSFTHVFKSAKTVRYYCSYHGGPGGTGMSGVVTVQNGGTPNKRAISITGNTLASFTIDVNDTVTWTNNHNMVHNVRSDN
jgi:plastocyanin